MNLSNSDLTYIQWTIQTSKTFLYYANLTIIPLGIFLNLLKILIFLRKRFKNKMIGFYYIIISISDILGISFGFVLFIGQSLNYDLSSISNFTCKFLNFGLRVFLQLSSWLSVLANLDLLYFVKYPNNSFQFLKNKFIVSIIIACLYILITIINIL